MKIYGFIFARGGSKGVPKKNIKMLGDKPLIAHTISVARKSKYITDVYVSTDSKEIQDVALEYGAKVPFLRPPELATDESREIDSWIHMIKNIDDFDIFVSLPTVSPMKTPQDIDGCIEEFLKKQPDLLLTVTKSQKFPGFNLIQINSDNYINTEMEYANVSNRQQSNYFDITTVCYVSTPATLLNKLKPNCSLINSLDNILTYEVSTESALDIDSNVDFLCAEKLYEENLSKKFDFSVKRALNLSGKTAIVTGGLGYVGKKIVESLIECFCKVIIIDINVEMNFSKEDTQFENVDYYKVNIEHEHNIIEFVEKIKTKYSKIDIIVNCAALVGTSSLDGWAVPFEEQSVGAWDKCININTRAPYILIQKCIPLLKQSISGSVINISSIYSNHAHNFNLYKGTNMECPIAYSVSKAGMNSMTRYLASLYGEHKIRFNNVILGGIERNQSPLFVNRYVEMVPLKRMGTENDIKGTIVFLASNLSLYVTGQDINVDGGYSIL